MRTGRTVALVAALVCVGVVAYVATRIPRTADRTPASPKMDSGQPRGNGDSMLASELTDSSQTRGAGPMEAAPSAQELDRPDSSVSTELSFEKKYEGYSHTQLGVARNELDARVKEFGNLEIQRYVVSGMAQWVPEDDDVGIRTSPSDDVIPCMAWDGGNYYLVDLTREHSPELFKLRDEFLWLEAALGSSRRPMNEILELRKQE